MIGPVVQVPHSARTFLVYADTCRRQGLLKDTRQWQALAGRVIRRKSGMMHVRKIETWIARTGR